MTNMQVGQSISMVGGEGVWTYKDFTQGEEHFYSLLAKLNTVLANVRKVP